MFFPPWTVLAKHGLHRVEGKCLEGKPGQWRHLLPSNEVVMLFYTERAVSTPWVLSAAAPGDQMPEFHALQQEDRTTLGPLRVQSHVFTRLRPIYLGKTFITIITNQEVRKNSPGTLLLFSTSEKSTWPLRPWRGRWWGPSL